MIEESKRDTTPHVHRGKTNYQKPQYKQWFKKFTNERTAGAYHYLDSLRKPTLMTQVQDILQYVETLEELNTMVTEENKFLRHEVKTLKDDLYKSSDDRNMEVSKRLNANKNEAYYKKKTETLQKQLFRANKVNKKLYFLLDGINKQISFLKTMNIFKENY